MSWMMKKDVFCLVTSMGQRKNSEFPWGIEPLTFGFHTVMLYHGARIGVNQTLRLSESESLRFDCCDITMVIWWLSDLYSDALPLSWNWSVALEVWGSIPHGNSEFFLCPTLVTRQKTSFFISSLSSKLTISLIIFTSWMILAFWLVLTYDPLETDA